MEEKKVIKMNEVYDEIDDMKFDLEKVKVLLEHLEDEHFNIPNIKNHTDDIKDSNSSIFGLVWEYDKNFTIFEIMCDYIYSISEKMNVLSEGINRSNNKDTAA